MFKKIKQFLQEEDGISSVEYAILLAFIAVALIVAVGALRDKVIAAFNTAIAQFP